MTQKSIVVCVCAWYVLTLKICCIRWNRILRMLLLWGSSRRGRVARSAKYRNDAEERLSKCVIIANTFFFRVIYLARSTWSIGTCSSGSPLSKHKCYRRKCATESSKMRRRKKKLRTLVVSLFVISISVSLANERAQFCCGLLLLFEWSVCSVCWSLSVYGTLAITIKENELKRATEPRNASKKGWKSVALVQNGETKKTQGIKHDCVFKEELLCLQSALGCASFISEWQGTAKGYNKRLHDAE